MLYIMFSFLSARSQRTEQHAEREEGGALLQPRAQGRLADGHGAPQAPLHQEQLPLPQGQDAEGGDDQANIQRRGE